MVPVHILLYLSINNQYYLIVTNSLAVHIPFPSIAACKHPSSTFGCPPSKQALQVITGLRVLIQATQHEDDTLL